MDPFGTVDTNRYLLHDIRYINDIRSCVRAASKVTDPNSDPGVFQGSNPDPGFFSWQLDPVWYKDPVSFKDPGQLQLDPKPLLQVLANKVCAIIHYSLAKFMVLMLDLNHI